MMQHILILKRANLDKDLKHMAYETVINSKYDGYQRVLSSIVFKFLDKKTGSGVSVNEQIAKELHKPVIKKIKRIKVYARFKDIIWTTVSAEIGPLSSKNKKFK